MPDDDRHQVPQRSGFHSTADDRTDPYNAAIARHLARVELVNERELDRAVDLLHATIRADGLIVTAGAGHSLAAVAETFYRAGGLACVRPLYHPALFPLHGAATSTIAERRVGLAAEVLADAPIAPPDLLVIFSTSGVNPYPVELVHAARSAGCTVIAVTSPTATAAAPRRTQSSVGDEATLVLDTLVPPGDAAYPPGHPVTAPLSGMTAAFVWNALLVRLVHRARADGDELPLWRSANTVGGDAANADLLARYRPRITALG